MTIVPASRRLRLAPGAVPASSPARAWRITTAVRAFALAVATGQVVGGGTLSTFGPVLLALGIVAATCCAIDLQTGGPRTPWAPAAEGVVVSVLIGTQTGPVSPLLMYLAIPGVVAGLRHGRLAATNAWLAATAALLATQAAGPAHDQIMARVGIAVPWLVAGLGAGLLAGSQTRSMRRLEAAQAPYSAAHRLVGQLHTLVHDQPDALDVGSHSRALQSALRVEANADRSTVLVRTSNGTLEPLSSHGTVGPHDEEMALECVARCRPVQRCGITALPLRVGDHVFGALLLADRSALSTERMGVLQQQVDEHAIRLETALLIDDVRALATTEERNRLAREIHDGVAQRIVHLGYLADDVAAEAGEGPAERAAEALRAEVTRLVSELRFSVFDLRHAVGDAGSLSGALSEYVRELSSHTDLRVHLTLDERGTRLPRRTECELLRIAQEALGNVHKHASAINVWVSLTVNGNDVQLVVEDDGVGGATPRTGHYGLHTMRERAERVGAHLAVGTRPDGGTVVTLRSRPTITTTKGAIRHDQRLARR